MRKFPDGGEIASEPALAIHGAGSGGISRDPYTTVSTDNV